MKVSQEELPQFVHTYTQNIQKRTDGAFVLGLMGDLGSGKTTFTQHLAKEFGIEEKITSPTFVIQKVYPTDVFGFKKFIHIDAYRLEGKPDMSFLKWQELLADEDNFIVIEWADLIQDVLPEDATILRFGVVGEDMREVN